MSLHFVKSVLCRPGLHLGLCHVRSSKKNAKRKKVHVHSHLKWEHRRRVHEAGSVGFNACNAVHFGKDVKACRQNDQGLPVMEFGYESQHIDGAYNLKDWTSWACISLCE